MSNQLRAMIRLIRQSPAHNLQFVLPNGKRHVLMPYTVVPPISCMDPHWLPNHGFDEFTLISRKYYLNSHTTTDSESQPSKDRPNTKTPYLVTVSEHWWYHPENINLKCHYLQQNEIKDDLRVVTQSNFSVDVVSDNCVRV